MSVVAEALTENDVYSSAAIGAASGVLSSEHVVSSVASSPKASLRVRVQIPAPSRALIETIERLFALGNLRAGWDSYDAKPVGQETIESAARWIPSLLLQATPSPAVVPQVNGGLQLEWHRKGVDLEIYIDSPENIHFAASDRTSGEEIESVLKGNEKLLRTWVTRISE